MLVVLAAATVSCGGTQHVVDDAVPDPDRWRDARDQLANLRTDTVADEPYTMKMALTMRQVPTSRTVRARGAVAVRPPYALRMVLLGPGGSTALDLWICRDTYKLSIPAIELERRGDLSIPSGEHNRLPVGFLRWWFLRPLSGRLLSYVDEEDARRFVVRDGSAVTQLWLPHDAVRPLVFERISTGQRQIMEMDRDRCGVVRYARGADVTVDVRCESIERQPAPDRAFADPDDASRLCARLP